MLTALNLELAKLEGKQKATALGLAGGLAVGAVVLVVYAIGFAFAAAAAGLAEALPLWLSLLIVAGAILLVAGILGFLAMRFARKASPPQPSKVIQEAEWDSQDAARKWLSAAPIRFARRWRLSGNASTRRARACELQLPTLVPVAAVALAVVGVITARVGVRAGNRDDPQAQLRPAAGGSGSSAFPRKPQRT